MKKLAISLALLLVLTMSGLAFADRLDGSDHGGRPLTATLIGANEFPGPGHPTATGFARITVNPGQEEICYELTASGLEGLTVVGAHIHAGGAGQTNPPLVGFTNLPTNGFSSGCTFVPREVALDIMKNPESYYVNIHAVPGYGPGAIRGQLSK